jgi:hypothetical protein
LGGIGVTEHDPPDDDRDKNSDNDKLSFDRKTLREKIAYLQKQMQERAHEIEMLRRRLGELLPGKKKE